MENSFTNWPKVPLAELFQLKQGKYASPNEMTERESLDFPFPVYGANGILGYASRKMYELPQVLITCRGSNCGLIQRTSADCWVSNNAIACVPKEGVHADFFYHLFKVEPFVDVITGSAQPQITIGQLGTKRVTCPPLPEQRAIASMLGSLDEKIELNRRQNATLETLAQTLFRAWFVDFEPVRAKGAGIAPACLDPETAALFPDEFDGDLPKGWRFSPLPDEIDFLEGPGLRNWQYTTEGMKFLNIRCINDGDLDTSKATCISEEEFSQKYRHFALQANDIVISTSGTLGRSAIVRKDHLPLMLNTSIIRMKGKGAIGLAYLWNFLRSDVFLNEMNRAATGSAQLNFGPMHLKKIEMLRPPDAILEAFEKIVVPLLEQTTLNRQQSRTLAAIRDQLLPRLLSGALRVPDSWLSRNESSLGGA